jgi:hypothetical protein
MTPAQIDEKIRSLTESLERRRDVALERFNTFMPERNLLSFHAYIGKNNNRFVDSVRTRFGGPDDFIAEWIVGLHASLDTLRGAHSAQTGRRPLECLVRPGESLLGLGHRTRFAQ